ncbi:hypothetical protein BS47DRAFT_1487730 [Hydnum rufescens UP504]|uniref:Uncharacterized protein n=1 Tax=Hydnum rufescens UP504 TaxID=1448309 RepID=A0A9P6AQ11_9AGAM|nr:hypothetical protein BS47DRAFT_1487730 [Hydnum rufescens UP504]
MNSIGITNPVVSPLTAAASGSGVVFGPSQSDIPNVPAVSGVSSHPEPSAENESGHLNSEYAHARGPFIQILTDWQAARSSNADHDPQPFYEVPPVPSRSPAADPPIGTEEPTALIREMCILEITNMTDKIGRSILPT